MSEQSLDALTRRASDAANRRISLLALGGAALVAGLAGAVGIEAKQNPAKKAKKKNKKKCNRAREACRARVLAVPDAPPEAVAPFLACCESCFSADFLTCLIANLD